MLKSFATVWNHPRATGAQPPQWWDWLLAIAVIVIFVVTGAMAENVLWRILTILLSVAIALTLPWRRSHPTEMIAVVIGTITCAQVVALLRGQHWNGLDSHVIVFILIPYALSRWASGREAVMGIGLVGIAFMSTLSVELKSWLEVLGTVVFYMIPAALGLFVRHQEHSKRRTLQQLRLQEREQLARELHDTVAHHVSAIAIQAQAGQALAATKPDAPVQILAVIEEAASRTLTEMRQIVQVLREDAQADRLPSATLADIKRLARDESCPLPVEVSFSGELHNLDSTVESTLYRLAQEATTNAARHAHSAERVSVQITGQVTQVQLIVSDDGDFVARQSPAGLGLQGMAERVALLGGTFHAAPGAIRGWVVEAALPKEGRR